MSLGFFGILLVLSAGCIAADTVVQGPRGPVDVAFVIDGHTSVLLEDPLSPEFAATYGPLSLHSSVQEYTLVTFDKPVAKFDEAIALDFTIYGESYHRILKRVSGNADPEIVTYQGRLFPEDESTHFFITFGPGNLVIASIPWNDTSIEVTPVQNRMYTEASVHPLHAVYVHPKSILPTPEPSQTPVPRPSNAAVNVKVPSFSIPGMTTSFIGKNLTDPDFLDEYGLTDWEPAFSGRNYFTFENKVPFDTETYIFTFTVNGKEYTVPMKNRHWDDSPDVVAYTGYTDSSDPDTIFHLFAGPGNRFSLSFVADGVPYKIDRVYSGRGQVMADSSLYVACSYYELLDLWEAKGSWYGTQAPPLPGELRLTPAYLSCTTGETIVPVSGEVFTEFPVLLDILNSAAPVRTAIISEEPVAGYAVYVSPTDAERLFDAYGSRPSQETYYWDTKYLRLEDGSMYVLEKGGIGLVAGRYPW